jgi:hypothetical protein
MHSYNNELHRPKCSPYIATINELIISMFTVHILAIYYIVFAALSPKFFSPLSGSEGS